MIDTVVLTMPSDMFHVFRPERFTPNCTEFFDPYSRVYRGQPWVKASNNPTKADIKDRLYMPRMTLFRRSTPRGPEVTLKIECSFPKLLYKTNFDELQDSDLEPILEILKTKVHDMGVLITLEALKRSPVSTIHYSKNIILTDHTSCPMILSQIEKVDLTQRLDLNRTQFRNEGHALHFHANSYQIAFYDKLKDLAQAAVSEKRAVEKDSYVQLNLFEERHVQPFEVLRMEVRLNSKVKIKSLFQQLNLHYEDRLDVLFSAMNSKAVLLHYWQEVTSKLWMLKVDLRDQDKAFDQLLRLNPKAKPEKMFLFQSSAAMMQKIGTRAFRKKMRYEGKRGNPKWYNLNSQMKATKWPENALYDPTEIVGQTLRDFRPLKLADYRLNFDQNFLKT